MDINNSYNGVSNLNNDLHASRSSPLQGPSSDLQTSSSQGPGSPDALASSALSPDKISYSGTRLVANSLTLFQLYRLETLLQAIQSPITEQLQKQISSHMTDPNSSQNPMRLPENTPAQSQTHAQAQAVESASEAVSKPGVGSVPVEPTVASVNAVLNKRPVQDTQDISADQQPLSDESLFQSTTKQAHQEVLDALNFTQTQNGMQATTQFLGLALPVKRTKIHKKTTSRPKSPLRPTAVLPDVPSMFVSLRHSITESQPQSEYNPLDF